MRMKKFIGFALLFIILSGCQNLSYVKAELEGNSMEPTISHKDIIYIDEKYYENQVVQRGDMIAFYVDQKDMYVKRVIGLPGETVEIKDNQVLVDGIDVSKDYIGEIITPNSPLVIVPEEMYFVLSDNIAIGIDSRHLGFISKEDIVGKIVKVEHKK
ncbi:signal peptidase I [Ornithinibacillus sp. 179-J 7C1 HS]|uniref:signal peptidase I n=1 Tax=Ornithinibacillus sp. 179-J 7C1 HS TaxID=3142384 RepID=UPI0039A0F385